MSSRSVGGAAWSYSRTLKDPDIEEPINLALHRPLAFRLLRPLERWTRRPSPNQVTLLSGAFGFASAYVAFVAAAGDVAWLRLAALLLFVSVILDCCDGMLARLTGASSELGRILDGGMDFFVANAVGLGLGVAILKHTTSPWAIVALLAAFPSMLAHAAVYDHLKKRFVELVAPRSDALDPHPTRSPLKPIPWALAAVYQRLYTPLASVVTGAGAGPRPAGLEPSIARERLRLPMRMASWLGVGTHFSILYVSMFFAPRDPLLPLWTCTTLITIVLNLWMLVTASAWRRAEAELVRRETS